ncbi:MAG: thioredoxin [Bilifractor sp.]|nr:thioredoxin [Lachnospiraceae bacterium]MDY2836733.1 thioredoxin [Bilifractor sp.]
MVKMINQNEFDAEVMQAKGLVVVDMYADWCGPCKMMAPVMDSLSEDYDDVKFVKVNVDNNPDLAAKFGVQSIPNFVFIKDGQKVDQVVGARDSESFEGIIERNK